MPLFGAIKASLAFPGDGMPLPGRVKVDLYMDGKARLWKWPLRRINVSQQVFAVE